MSRGKFSIEALFTATDRMSVPIAKIQSRMQKFGITASRSLQGLDRQLAGVHSGLMRIAGAAAIAGVAGAAIGASIGKTGAQFEQAITAVGAVSLQTREQIAELEAEAKRLGATTKFTATEAANAMEIMSQAGFTNMEILKGVGPVLDAASASGMEIAEVASHVSNALKGMGLDTSETARVADVLALASARTNSTIGTLGESLANVAATARQFNIPLEDTIAGVALLQDVGLDASVAGSALNVMLTQMASPTANIAAKMKQFGVTFKDAKGNMLPFQDVLQNISKAAQKSGGNMDQVAFFAELVGLRGQKAAANLKDLFDSGDVQDLTAELRNAAGSAKRMAEIRMDNTIGDFEKLTSAIDGVQIALFETQTGPLRGIIQSMTKWVEVNQDLIVFEFQVWIRRLTNSLPTIVKWLERIGTAILVFYSFAAAVKIARLAVFAYQGAVHIATGLTWLFGGAMKATRLATVLFTKAQIGARFWTLATSAATGIASAAQWAYVTPIRATSLATLRLKAAQIGLRLWLLLSSAATGIAAGTQVAYAAVVGATSTALAGFATAGTAAAAAIGAQMAALAPILITLGAVAAAVLALTAAWKQYNKLDKDLAGSGGISGTVGKMIEMGTFDPFKAHDQVMNDKARAARDEREGKAGSADPNAAPSLTDKPTPGPVFEPQMVTPQQRIAAETAEANATASVDGVIRVEAEKGTKATVKTQPNKVKLRPQQSGGF